MARFGPKSIRGRVTLMAGLATAVAMVVVVVAMGLATRAILENAIADSLRERLDQARVAVAAGQYDSVTDLTGNEVVQVIDENGNVVAGSRNARGLAAIDGDDGDEVDDLVFERDERKPAPALEALSSDGSDERDEAPSAPVAQDGDDAAYEPAGSGSRESPTDGGGGNSGGGVGFYGGRDDDGPDDDDADDGPDDPDDDPDSDDRDSDDDPDDEDGDDDGDAARGTAVVARAGEVERDDRDDDDDGDARRGGDEADGGDSPPGGRAYDDDADDGDDDYEDDGDSDDADGDDNDDDADSDDDDADSDGGGRKVRTSSLKQLQPQSQAQGVAALFARNIAWADEPGASPSGSASVSPSNPASPSPSPSSQTSALPASPASPSPSTEASGSGQASPVDAASVLGAEGPYLILKERVDSPDGPMTVVAVTSLAQATSSAQQMMWLLAAIMAVVLVAVIALAWTLTGRTLRPVEQMRLKAASITAENLSERIDVPQGDADLAPLAETLNEMLARVERSLEDEKRFISDASHELKSPIAATSIILDSMRAHPDAIDMPQAIEDLASENARMASVVGDMLALTRYDEGRLNCTPEPIDVMDIVFEEAMALRSRSDVAVDVSDVQPLTCRADAGLLSHALRNLLDNAARYAESLVKVTCEPGAGGAVVIRVSDDGPGIASEDRERVFGRFVCLDERSGTGLGLSVARAIVESNGGTLAFVDPGPGPGLSGATAEITFT